MKKSLKKSILFLLSVSLFFGFTTKKPVSAKERFQILNKQKIEFYKFEEKNGKLYLTLPGHLSSEEIMQIVGFQEESKPLYRSAAVIGAAIVKISKGIIKWCTVEQVITNDNICRRVYKWLENASNKLGHHSDVKLRVVLKQTFIPGRIPGCEPAHSYMCNQGRWEVEFATEELQ